jgi:hypothetical protein
VSTDEEGATSFGRVAGRYDRVRPGPPAAALDWLVPAGCRAAVDLAAGTGLFTRALHGRVAQDEDWVAELDLLRPGVGPRGTADTVRAYLDRHNTVTLPDGAAFGAAETASFRFSRTMPLDDVIDWLGTSSNVITASAASREAGLARCREVLLGRAVREPDGGGPVIEMPMRSWCWRADRLAAG